MTPNKRRKLNSGLSGVDLPGAAPCPGVHHVLGEVDLEIGLRNRLVETIESRITWASCLQNALKQESRDTFGSTTFRNAAMDAIQEIEDPLQVLLSREVPAPPNLALLQQKNSRPPPRPKIAPPTRNSNASFLYIKADVAPGIVPDTNGQHPPEYYLLRCPGCNRRTFTSLQGLLNHGRISHRLEWGTHDECVRACIAVDPDLDISSGTEVGLGPAGLLPGLRSLFEMAVGGNPPTPNMQVPMSLSAPTAGQNAHVIKTEAEEAGMDHVATDLQPTIETSHLTRTLGLHKDTPALAPFLGKIPIKRGIKLWDNGNDLDILGDRYDEQRDSKKRWRMPFPPRNDEEYQVAFPGGEHKATSNHRSTSDTSHAIAPPKNPSMHSSDSRFHFSVRVILADRSLWVPPEQRQQQKEHHTHKWMISVASPSYSRNVTTVLRMVSVRLPSKPDAQSEVLSSAGPPFAVVGTTDEPFLATVELLFNGTTSDEKHEQPVIVEHWVDLDPLRSANVVLGEEQIIDVELDHTTLITEQKTDYLPLTSRVLWDTLRTFALRSSEDRTPQQDSVTNNGDDYSQVLESLLPKCPMTLKDATSHRTPRLSLPYKLVSTPNQFKSLIPGRRKAIEWGRARALQELYAQSIHDLPVKQRPPSLSTADIYTWLSENGHFPRPRPPSTAPTAEITREGDEKLPTKNNHTSQAWCAICGLSFDIHPPLPIIEREFTPDSLKNELNANLQMKYRLQNVERTCTIVPPELQISQIPTIDLNEFSTFTRPPLVNVHAPANHYQPSDLLAVAEPRLTLAIHDVMKCSGLPGFNSSSANLAPSMNLVMHHFILDNDETRDSLESRLAPHAILALATTSFLKVLVRGGLEIAHKDRMVVTAQSAPASTQIAPRKGMKKNDDPTSMLTPVHVLRGVVERGRNRRIGVDVPVFECLAQVGMAVDMNRPFSHQFAGDGGGGSDPER